ncbi:MAG: hypothetical protein PHU61_02695 [Candidatus Absconditabacteria bacterium]|nr:hypothetical protein [Candidatus Absconditabacteria bacterium]MDD3868120.1 hypothetical protein [Candidatus Absconditabacteria bacterium]MDD4714506.1 hypothetical protein [Candidatus Absconditabacteria bacterium]
MLRKYLIQRYVDVKGTEEILGHSSFIFLRGVLLYSVLLFLIYLGYALGVYFAPEVWYVKRIAGIAGLVLFIRRVFVFLNLYLDCLLFSKNQLTVFLREGLLEYRTEVIDRSKINVVSHSQNSLRDKLFGKGDITIQLGNNVDFSFHDVSAPKRQVAKMMLYKQNYEEEQKQKIEKDLEGDQKNFDVLVDALGEVIKEYLEEKSDFYEIDEE